MLVPITIIRQQRSIVIHKIYILEIPNKITNSIACIKKKNVDYIWSLVNSIYKVKLSKKKKIQKIQKMYKKKRKFHNTYYNSVSQTVGCEFFK